jgi:hypothetical protein
VGCGAAHLIDDLAKDGHAAAGGDIEVEGHCCHKIGPLDQYGYVYYMT